jgi:hypothetical protein
MFMWWRAKMTEILAERRASEAVQTWIKEGRHAKREDAAEEEEASINEKPDMDEEDQHVKEEHVTAPSPQRPHISFKLGIPADKGLIVMVRKEDGAQVIVRKSSLDRLQEKGVIDHVIDEIPHDESIVTQQQGRVSSPIIKEESEDSEESNIASITPDDYD